ncbi:MAG: dimethylsulfonioproprionate lyase family protein [Kiloniellales bacterium]
MSEALTHFRDTLAAFYLQEAERAAGGAHALRTIAQRLRDPGLARGKPERQDLPAMAQLAETLGMAEAGPLGALASAFAAVEPELAWVQNSNYADAGTAPDFLRNYAYCVVAGPKGLLQVDDILVSAIVIGPECLYPAHAHEAEEVYHLLAGPSYWWREGEDWVWRKPGACIHHRSWQQHATKTASTSMLAIASWKGDSGKLSQFARNARIPALPSERLP